jgi:hypothetical protein
MDKNGKVESWGLPAGVRAKIQTGHIHNASQEHY